MVSNEPRVLVITLSNIGDLIMTTPVLEALHEIFPEQPVDIVCDRRSSDLLVECPYRGDILHRDKRDGWRGLVRLVARLRRRRYELVVDLRTHVLPLALHCRRWVSKYRNRPAGPHAVEEHFATLQKLEHPPTAIPPTRVWFDRAAADRAADLLRDLPGDRWLAIAPGANWPGKIWPTENFIELVGRCASRFDGIVILGSTAETKAAAEVAARASLPAVDLCGRTGLTEAAAALAMTTAFVGNDSGLGHIAAATGTPTLTVFGPGRPERYHPWGPRADYVIGPERDLEKLDAATVAERLTRHLERIS